ncbi:aminotransferase class IV [Agrobacterium vitis]|uniref:aminotransferase class IV family protein n=1 Tax=Rhizobium/Agrobacterium group TaxID=227290 RepID=UPI0012E94598|nr:MULTISPECIES: aminotransferase class IV family protein [Rhizobium/Agrobacterium group]MCF1492522.1 aminotransferase class IV [Allorhizobium ampelinum]MVA44514.1 aminotransferase class IV [Agrobacterium vitis]
MLTNVNPHRSITMSTCFPSKITLNGHAVSADDLAPLAFSGFAHFTAMQVRQGRVRGLDLHLERLRLASLAMFGMALPDEQVRAHLHAVLNGAPNDLSLTATIFSRSGEFTVPAMPDNLAILVRTALPSNGPAGPLRLDVVLHERPLASIKHVGESAKTYYLRKAVERGFDDAAFLDTKGRLSEATIWNLVFWDGEAVVWPRADMLHGVTMGIIRRQLEKLGIPQRQQEVRLEDLKNMTSAALMNSWTPGIAISSIETTNFTETSTLTELLHRAYQAEPAISIG